MVSAISTNSMLSSLRRQVVHWKEAASRLAAIDHLVSSAAWHGVESNLGKILRKHLQKSTDDVLLSANNLFLMLDSCNDQSSIRNLKRSLLNLRDQYLKAEETLHFYTVAVNSRTNG